MPASLRRGFPQLDITVRALMAGAATRSSGQSGAYTGGGTIGRETEAVNCCDTFRRIKHARHSLLLARAKPDEIVSDGTTPT